METAFRTIRVELPHLGLLHIEGPDAATFLQSQLTSDVLALIAVNEAQWTGYCNPKGRLYFTGWLAKTAAHRPAFALMIDRSMTQAMLKRLRMFVLRSKLSVDDLSHGLTLHGSLSFEGADESERTPPHPSPASIALPAARTYAGPLIHRFIESKPAKGDEQSESDGRALSDQRDLSDERDLSDQRDLSDPNPEHRAIWHWVHQLAAEAWIDAGLSERFVPQMINFERIGGVNFRKGCYPGQEVVARSQYLGKLKRRSRLYRIDDASQSLPVQGQELGEASNPELTIISATACPGTLGKRLWHIAFAGLAADDSTDSELSAPAALVFAEGRTDSLSQRLGKPIGLPYALHDEA